MPTPSSGSESASDTELPDPVTNALDEVETGLSTDAPTDEPARRALANEVTRYLERQLRDPIPRALLSRPKIFAWALDRAVAQAGPGSGERGWGSFRRADPLVEEPGEASQPQSAEPSTAPSTRRKGRKS